MYVVRSRQQLNGDEAFSFVCSFFVVPFSSHLRRGYRRKRRPLKRIFFSFSLNLHNSLTVRPCRGNRACTNENKKRRQWRRRRKNIPRTNDHGRRLSSPVEFVVWKNRKRTEGRVYLPPSRRGLRRSDEDAIPRTRGP